MLIAGLVGTKHQALHAWAKQANLKYAAQNTANQRTELSDIQSEN